jgi:hypothetical protein
MGRLNFRKDFSLDGAAPGWTKEHFITLNNFKYKDVGKFKKLGISSEDDIDEEKLDKMASVLGEKFVSGKVFIEDAPPTPILDDEGNQTFDDEGQPLYEAHGHTEDAVAEDINELPAMFVNGMIEWAMGKMSPKQPKSLKEQSSSDAPTS